MRKYIWIILFFAGQFLLAQSKPINRLEVSLLNGMPKENVFVHFNTPLLFSGEYLHYKLYVRNPKNFEPSSFSDIGYVELVGEDKTVVFKHKIRLEKGYGNGDFFIPVTVPSGNYKLLAYTQWMKNHAEHYFFKDDLSIINPYQGNQKAILSQTKGESSSFPNQSILASNKMISLKADKNIYSKRSKVLLDISGLQENFKGNFSISAHQKSPMKTEKNLTTASFFKGFSNMHSSFSNNVVYLPELRGELLTGKITGKTKNRGSQNIRIGFSIPSNDGYVLKISTTDDDGDFYVNLDEKYNGDRAIVQIIDNNKEDFEIVMNEHQSVDYSSLKFRKFKITSDAGNYIKQRSIHNQIENGYFGSKPDSILIHKTSNPFKSSENIVYNLDDYTRFKTIKETFVEVIENAWFTKTKNDGYIFQVRGEKTSTDYFSSYDLKPIVLLDGILIQNHNSLMDYDARKVQNIIINRHKYVYGHEIFKGVIIIETIKGDYKLPISGNHIKYIELFKPTESKKYYKQIYSEENELEMDRIPDFRYQLLWQPNLILDGKSNKLSFFTSDVEGDFEISLEGFTDEGKPVSVKKTITVN